MYSPQQQEYVVEDYEKEGLPDTAVTIDTSVISSDTNSGRVPLLAATNTATAGTSPTSTATVTPLSQQRASGQKKAAQVMVRSRMNNRYMKGRLPEGVDFAAYPGRSSTPLPTAESKSAERINQLKIWNEAATNDDKRRLNAVKSQSVSRAAPARRTDSYKDAKDRHSASFNSTDDENTEQQQQRRRNEQAPYNAAAAGMGVGAGAKNDRYEDAEEEDDEEEEEEEEEYEDEDEEDEVDENEDEDEVEVEVEVVRQVGEVNVDEVNVHRMRSNNMGDLKLNKSMDLHDNREQLARNNIGTGTSSITNSYVDAGASVMAAAAVASTANNHERQVPDSQQIEQEQLEKQQLLQQQQQQQQQHQQEREATAPPRPPPAPAKEAKACCVIM